MTRTDSLPPETKDYIVNMEAAVELMKDRCRDGMSAQDSWRQYLDDCEAIKEEWIAAGRRTP